MVKVIIILFWQVALLGSLINGKVFMEWVCPAVLKAYQWQVCISLKYSNKFRHWVMVLNLCSHNVKPIEQVRSLETSYREVSDIYDIGGVKGLSNNCIQKLSVHKFYSSKMIKSCHEFCCSICLQVSSEHKYLITFAKIENINKKILYLKGWFQIKLYNFKSFKLNHEI